MHEPRAQKPYRLFPKAVTVILSQPLHFVRDCSEDPSKFLSALPPLLSPSLGGKTQLCCAAQVRWKGLFLFCSFVPSFDPFEKMGFRGKENSKCSVSVHRADVLWGPHFPGQPAQAT